MKKNILFFSFFILLSCNLEPKIEFEKKIIDIGTIPYKTSKTFYIKFKNVGGKELEVQKIQPSCMCLLKSTSRKILSSNEIDSVKFNYFATEKGSHEEKIVFLLNTKKRFEIIQINSKVK